jgi:hypothetical protein
MAGMNSPRYDRPRQDPKPPFQLLDLQSVFQIWNRADRESASRIAAASWSAKKAILILRR